MYYASNFEQGGGEVTSLSVLGKAKVWNDAIARNCWRNAGENLEMILACCTSPQNKRRDLE